VSEAWRIDPEPTEEELAALTAVIFSVASARIEAEPEIVPISMWRREARRESIDSGVEDHWDARY
jgi:hypothetical protein